MKLKLAWMLLLCFSLTFCQSAFGQEELLRLAVASPEFKEWYYGTVPAPPSDQGSFKIPAAGIARVTYAGSPYFEQQLSCLKTDHWVVNQLLIPGGDVEPMFKEVKDGKFKFVWLKKFTAEEAGREVKVKLGAWMRSGGLVSAYVPAQGSIFVVEWLGNEPIPPNTIEYNSETTKDDSSPFAGTWTDNQSGDSWEMTKLPDGTYDVKGTFLKGITGKGVVKDDNLKVEFVSTAGVKGTFDVKLDPSGKTGAGVVRTDEPAQFNSTITLGNPSTETTIPAGFTAKAATHQLKSGQTLNIPVEILDASGISNLNVVVEYSSDVVRVNSAPAAGNVRTDHLFQANAKDPGLVRIGLAGKSSVQANGQLALIPFTAVGPPGTKTELKIRVTTANNSEGKNVPAKTTAGLIEIVADSPPPTPPAPPVVLTPKDAMEALMMSVQLRPEDFKLDLDKDGAVTSNDARLILREVVTR
jgi:hypothetical protein